MHKVENNRGKRKIILTDVLEIVIIELPKIYRKRDKKDKLLEWTYFLDNPKSEEVEEIMKENEGIKKANEKLEEISDDEIMQRIAEWKADGIRLEKGRQAKQARLERRLKELEEEKEVAHKEGVVEGIEQGKREEVIKMVKSLEKEGLGISFIMKITGLTKEEIDSIQKL